MFTHIHFQSIGAGDPLRALGFHRDEPWNPGTRWATIRDSEGNTILVQTI